MLPQLSFQNETESGGAERMLSAGVESTHCHSVHNRHDSALVVDEAQLVNGLIVANFWLTFLVLVAIETVEICVSITR